MTRYCDECGSPLVTEDSCEICNGIINPDLDTSLRKTQTKSDLPTSPTNTGKNPTFCSDCGEKLIKDKSFCPNCGSKSIGEALTPEINKPIKTAALTNKKPTSKLFLYLVFGFVALFLISIVFSKAGGPSGPTANELCFQQEMRKIGAYADPKGWAVQSRIYCNSLYPP